MQYQTLNFEGGAGGTPTFSLFRCLDTASDLPQPQIFEIGGDWFYFPYDASSSGAPAVGSTIAFTAELNGVTVPGTLIVQAASPTTNSSVTTTSVDTIEAYELFFGEDTAGSTPSFVRFERADTHEALPQPQPTEIGNGRFGFVVNWTALSPVTAIDYLLTVGGGNTQWAVITPSTSVSRTAAAQVDAPGLVTLASLRLAAQQRSDTENDPHISDSEWRTYINGSYGWLYGLLLEKYGEEYQDAKYGTFTTSGAEFYPMASDFLKLLGVEMQSGGDWLTLRPFAAGERNRASLPDSGTTIRYRYAPRLTKLVNDTDTLDGVNGWEELIIVDAARKAVVKQERDATDLKQEIAALIARIDAEAQFRDVGEAPCVVDVYAPSWEAPLRYRTSGNSLWLRQVTDAPNW